MSGTLPTVRGGFQALFPVTRRVEFLTDIAVGLNATEQRFKKRPPLTTFNLPYTRMSNTDLTAFKNFFASQKGQFDSTWSLTLGGTTYSHLTLLDDAFTFTENPSYPKLYDWTIRARQTQNSGYVTPSGTLTFPALANGLKTQLPYTQIRRFAVLLNDNPIGPRYSWTWYGGGLSGFPAGALHAWTFSYPALGDTDLATLENFFRICSGQYQTFGLTDPDDATAYTKVRFSSDVLEVQYLQPGISSLTLAMMETN